MSDGSHPESKAPMALTESRHEGSPKARSSFSRPVFSEGDPPFLKARQINVGSETEFYFYDPASKREEPLKVFAFIPEGWNEETPVLFVMHGVNRDAKEMFHKLVDKRLLPQKHHFILLVPYFSQEQFPTRAEYNCGGVFAQEDLSKPRDRKFWSFTAIENFFLALKVELKLAAPGYHIFGHSAGAQFVHRLVAFSASKNNKSHIIKAVAANAGFYSMPSLDMKFPYGLGRCGQLFTEEDLRIFLEAPLVVLLGEEDTDPNHKHLPIGKLAAKQGKHRFERGQSFFEAGLQAAEHYGVCFGWQLQTIPGVAHEGVKMCESAVKILFPRINLPGEDAWSGSDYDSATQLSARQRHKQSFLMRVAKKRERAIGKENCHTEGAVKDMS
mmetsp:Transcript_45481/g.142862  ORF Transcript_45481/g.142862 Transcript_45481/m.142862 type:complete len:385 (-) Transcript_45481:53-1207(-)